MTLQLNPGSRQPPCGMIRQFCPLDQTGANLIKAAMQQMRLNARAYHRTRSASSWPGPSLT